MCAYVCDAAVGSNLEVGGCKYNTVVMIFLIKAAEEQLHEYTLGNQRREALYCDWNDKMHN